MDTQCFQISTPGGSVGDRPQRMCRSGRSPDRARLAARAGLLTAPAPQAKVPPAARSETGRSVCVWLGRRPAAARVSLGPVFDRARPAIQICQRRLGQRPAAACVWLGPVFDRARLAIQICPRRLGRRPAAACVSGSGRSPDRARATSQSPAGGSVGDRPQRVCLARAGLLTAPARPFRFAAGGSVRDRPQRVCLARAGLLTAPA